MDKLKSIYTPKLEKLMTQKMSEISNPIFVFMGVSDYVDMDAFIAHVVDPETFAKNGNEEIFDKKRWFPSIFSSLILAENDDSNPYTIISFAQFSYLIENITPDYFKSRVVIVKDGVRTLFPLDKDDYIETSHEENIEARPDNMPVYMGEQIKRGNYYYYTAKTPIEDYTSIILLDKPVKLEESQATDDYEVIDVASDLYSIDEFLNTCIIENRFDRHMLVKVHNKHPREKTQDRILKIINGLLKNFGGELLELVEPSVVEEFTPRKETVQLLKQYWGEKAAFRKMQVYQNPDYDKKLISISQGLIVETIINEYNNAKNNRPVKDLFLTAPTGAGKSLLFQLPAFHVSANNDVTIVVSPLIALMEDQVAQIKSQRKFDKVFCLNSNLSLIDRDRVIEACKAGEIDILYMSPELLLSYDISFFIGNRRLGLLVIDEAHLITTWGRDFRVDYWFLGLHINKIRKYQDYTFPMVAVTATAIYGGENDMVFDSINSLYMHDPYMFIGEVKRKNILFAIDNHDRYTAYQDNEKINETVSFIQKIANLDYKTIVYAPFTVHVEQIVQRLNIQNNQSIAVSYHGGYDADIKSDAYLRFKTGSQKIMVCTKAFGMGVDIPDIQVVYHHAPSGMLPDYVQEIGRAARLPEITGVAALNYAVEDQKFSKLLHGMSAIRTWQLQEILKKIYKQFLGHKRMRNMLLAVDDFGYIFNNAKDLDQKVMTSLMMLEKDYLAKYRFNILIARPKKLFVKVYARTDALGYMNLKRLYPRYYKLIYKKNDLYYLELDLDKIWEEKFVNSSFPRIKHDFYKGVFLDNEGITLVPQVKFSISLDASLKHVTSELNNLLDNIKKILLELSEGYFKATEFKDKLHQYISDDKICDKITRFFLTTYSGRLLAPGKVENNAFLQRRKIYQSEDYRVFNTQYNQSFASIKRLFSSLFDDSKYNSSYRFVSSGSDYLTDYIRLGSLLEFMKLGSYESRGGNSPMIFVRINDPLRIERDGNDPRYKNTLLEKTNKRFKSSSEIFDHFFLHSIDNDTRWNFIEDYFLGKSNDDLFDTYPVQTKSHVDIIEYIKNHVTGSNSGKKAVASSTMANIFVPKEGEFYNDDRQLTIGNSTKSISRWITSDPMELHKMIVKYNLRIPADSYKILMSKLNTNHFAYLRDTLGLRLYIDFPNFPKGTMAKVIYEQEPVKFYKWWKQNEDKVTMSRMELIRLLLKVQELSPQSLVKRHKDLLKSRK